MQAKKLFGRLFSASYARQLRMHRAASRERRRIILRPWVIEPLVDRALLAALSGLHSIGPTGDYSSIGSAISSIQTEGLAGPLTLELQASYVSSVETFPLVFSNLGTTVVNTITLRPELSATNLLITSADTTAATIDLNGAQFLTIDGRSGGVGSHAGSGGGTASKLTIANTSTSGIAMRFINEASNNTIFYTTFRGVSSRVVDFGATTEANGNDNNTIDHCDIRNGVNTPANGIYSQGSIGTTAQNNSGNTVSNCNVFNFYSSTTWSSGVWLNGGNTNWTISGNSFYQTTTRQTMNGIVRPIFIDNPSGNNFTVTGNFIGGDSPGASVTSQKWTTMSSPSSYLFFGIWLNVGTSLPSIVQGNSIANIIWNSSGGGTLWSGIHVQAGSANIGTTTSNTIGNGTGTGSISVTALNLAGTAIGIGSDSSGEVTIANNSIGSISVNGAASTISASLTGIRVTAGMNTITNNTVGSTTTANSLNAATSSTSGTDQQVTGIFSSSDASASIAGNTVANLNNNSASTIGTGFIRGIAANAGVNNITGNTIRNLSTTSGSADIYEHSVTGISSTSSAAGQTVSRNVVHSLANAAPLRDVNVTGIYFHSIEGRHLVEQNFVHSLSVSSNSTLSKLNGMYFDEGAVTVRNNIVRVGLDSNGNSTAGLSFIYGIYSDHSSVNRVNFYHNSVYIGGVQGSGTSGTYAFNEGSVFTARTVQNNIFVNARSNNGATSKHYAVQYNGTTLNTYGLIAGGNLFFVDGTGGLLGRYGNADRMTLGALQAATGQDATSAVADPMFGNPTGTASSVDLHLLASNPAEMGGTPLTDALTGIPAYVTDDFDGQTRSSLTPADIGADAGNFTSSSGDIYAPGISYPLLTSGTTANRVLNGWATISDNVAVANGANAPRLYFKKSTDADLFSVANDATGNGWKYVIATGNGPYSFTIDYSIINGGSVGVGDGILYFVVAQDASNNLGSSPIIPTASANPPVQNISARPGTGVNAFSIVAGISGTRTVGSGGDYPSLTGTGGLFAALNSSVLTGNVVVNITSDLAESGTVSLNELKWNEYPFANNTLSLKPDSATMRTIVGSTPVSLIRLNGADRVTIDGSLDGNGRYLTFRNTSTGSTANTIHFINGASHNTIRNSIVEGAGTSVSYGVIGFGDSLLTGNDYNLITGCQVRDLSTAAGAPSVLIDAVASSDAPVSTGNIVSNNELFNFNRYAIRIASNRYNAWTISANNIYEVNAATGVNYGIYVYSGGSNFVTGNYVHDLHTSDIASYGIYFAANSGVIGTTTVAGNRINLRNVNTTTTNVFGIYGNGDDGSTLNVVNNQVSLSTASVGSNSLYGIYDTCIRDCVVNAFYNSVVIGGMEDGIRSSFASYRIGSSAHTARDNVFLNLRTGGTGATRGHFAVGNEFNSGGSFTISHNIYAGTGRGTAANFMDFSSSPGSAAPVDFATWQSLTGDTNSQGGIAGTGGFTSAMFVDVANGDLHLVPGGNPLVTGMGIPIPGITTDFDGDLRSPTAPNIGSDEQDLAPPTILGIFAAGAAWSGALIDAVDGGGIGAGNGLGYALNSGLTLPNAGVDRIYIQFSEPVVGFNASTVALLGVDVADYSTIPGFMNVSYDSLNRRGVIQLSSSIAKDKLRLGVSDVIQDLAMNALDGDSNTSAGGDLDLRFNVLIGDANNDGSVNGGDLPFFAMSFNQSAGSFEYIPRADWNADGAVNGGDLPAFAIRFNQSLPIAEPGALSFPPMLTTSLDSESAYAPIIEEIDDFFSQLDEEDEFLLLDDAQER